MKATLLIAAAVTAAYGCASPAAADEPKYPNTFMEQDGIYLVGTDIRPGLYLTMGGVDAGNCSWTRTTASGTSDHGGSSEAQYILIAPTDKKFETNGCGAWAIRTRVATPIAPPGRTCIYPLTGCIDPQIDAPRP